MTGRVGFTGTGRGMTPRQRDEVQFWLRRFAARGATEFHHGDCVGADAEAHELARELGYRIVAHPPDNPKSRAYCAADEVRPEAPYLTRNRAIVAAVSVMIAAPATADEQVRSGTWATVRYTRAAGKHLFICGPGEP